MSPQCPCATCQRKMFWLPTISDMARYVLHSTAAVGLLMLGMALGTSTTARLAIGAYQREIDAQASTQACSALIDDGTRLTLDATLLARALSGPRAEPWVEYTVDAGTANDVHARP